MMGAEDRKSGANSEGRDNKGRFAKGNAGKPRGCRHKATMLAQTLLEDGIEDAVKTILAAVREGDVQAARVVIDKLLPAVKERPVSLSLPATETAAGVSEAQQKILEAVAAGVITLGEASTLSGIVEAHRKAIETVELEQRIGQLEAKSK